jgi:integrase
MEGEKRVKTAILRHKGRKHPIISFIFMDNSEQAMTVKADLRTAQKILFRAKQEIALGTFDIESFFYGQSNDGIAIGELRDRFLEYRQKLVHIGHLSKATYEHDQLSMNTLCDRIGIDTKISSLTRDDVINFLVLLKDSRTRRGKTFTPGAINSYLRNIKTAFNWAVSEKLIRENPFQGISKLPDPMERQFRYLEEETIEKIRRYLAEKPEWQLDIFNFCLWTGARRAEAFNITKQNSP